MAQLFTWIWALALSIPQYGTAESQVTLEVTGLLCNPNCRIGEECGVRISIGRMEKEKIMNARYRLLRFLLIFVGCVNFVAVPAVLTPWESSASILTYLGVKGVPGSVSHPIMEYWLVVMIAFSLVVGYLFLVAGINPTRHRGIVSILGYGWIFIGPIVGWHGLRLQIPPYPLYADLGLCLIPGPLIVWLARGRYCQDARVDRH